MKYNLHVFFTSCFVMETENDKVSCNKKINIKFIDIGVCLINNYDLVKQ